MTNLVLVLVKHWLSGKSRHVALHLVTCGLFIACPSLLLAQSYTSSTGTPSFAAPYPVEMGQVDAASGDLHLELPIATYPQRGGATTRLSIAYDSHIWAIQPNGASPF